MAPVSGSVGLLEAYKAQQRREAIARWTSPWLLVPFGFIAILMLILIFG